MFKKKSLQFQLPTHRFMLRQIAPLRDLVFKLFSAVPTSTRSFQFATECTIKQSYFQKFLRSPNIQNITSNSVRMRRLAFLILKFSQHFPPPPKGKINSGWVGAQPPIIFLLRVNFILPTLRPWSNTLQWCSQEAAKYHGQRWQMSIPCQYMIKIMNIKKLYMFNI